MTSTSERKLVLCVGICCLDLIQVCDDYPKEDSDTRSRQGRWQRGGNPANNCTVLALMDQPCEYLGVFSADPMFGPVIEDFRRRGILIRHCPSVDAEIPMSSVVLSGSTGSRTIVHSNANLRELTVNDFANCDLRDYEWIHFEPRTSDVRLMMESVQKWNNNNGESRKGSQSASSERICISLELEKPAKHPLDFAELCDVLFIGQDYAEKALHAEDMTQAVMKARALIKNKNMKIICAWGASGSAALDNFAETEVVVSPACPPDVIVDTLGAGDTFCAAVIYALMRHRSLEESLRFGNRIAGAKIGFYGYDGIQRVYQGMW